MSRVAGWRAIGGGARRRSRAFASGAVVSVLVLTTACAPSSGKKAASPTTDPRPTRPAPTPVARPTRQPGPPYRVSESTVRLVDHSRPTVAAGRRISAARVLTTQVWFPTAAGKWPLVVFGPGYQVGPDPYRDLLRAWAGHGYVVAAVEFPLTDAAVAGSNLDEADIDNEPADLRFVTDELAAGSSPLAGKIDPTRVGIAGHSDGAETALAASLDPVPAGQPRYRAVIAMSAQPLLTAPWPNPPLLVTQGDADSINPPPLGYRTWQEARSPKYLLLLRGGGHLPPLESGSAWLPGIEAVTEAFLDTYLAGDRSPASIVTAAGPWHLLSLK